MAQRTTTGLDQTQIDNIEAAEAFARLTLDLPLNTYVVAHLDQVRTDGNWATRRQRLQARIAKWMARRNLPLLAVWTVEANSLRVHLNVLLHLPDSGTRSDLERYLQDRCAEDPDAFRVQLVNRSPRNRPDVPPWRGVLDYVCKGVTPDVARARPRAFSLQAPQGRITGKRCGTTQNLGPAARARHARQRAAA